MRATDFIAYQCVHGLGHGLMIHTGLDLPLSLSICERLPTAWDQTSCDGGVFMENFSSSYGVKSRFLRDNDPVYPCHAVAEKHKLYCYLQVTSRLLQTSGYDWKSTAQACARVERNWRATCFQSYGRDASGVARLDAAELVRLCNIPAAQWRGECVYGAVRDIANNDAGAARAGRFCGLVAMSLRPRCFNGAGSIISDLTRSAGRPSSRVRGDHEAVPGGVPAPRGRLRARDAARALDRLERDPPPGRDVRADRVSRRPEIARLEGVDDRAVLGREVRAALELAAPDHLHHQVDGEVAVEAGEQRVRREVDLVLVEGGVRGVPARVRDGRDGLLVQLPEAAQLVAADPPDGRLRRLQLERQPDVVALRDRRPGQRRHVVAAARLDGEETLCDESGEGVVDGAARDAELGRELVQAHLLAGAELRGARAGA